MSTTNSAFFLGQLPFFLEPGRQFTSPTPSDQSYSPSIVQRQQSASDPPETLQPKAVDRYREAFHDSLAGAMRDRLYSDLLIVSDSATFKAHKLIVCPQSRWFAEQIERHQRFGINSSIEVEEGSVKIVVPLRFSDETIGCVVSFLYSQDYECGCDCVADAILAHVRVLDAASHLEIWFLTDLAEEKLHALLPTRQKDVSLYGMVNVITEVYRLSRCLTIRLRSALVEIVASCPQELHGPMNRAWILRECVPQEFVADLVAALAKKLETCGAKHGDGDIIAGQAKEEEQETGAEEDGEEWASAKEERSEKSVDGALGTTW